MTREHKPSCNRTVAIASTLSAALAALLSPFPLADEVLLVPLYACVVANLARIHGVTLRKVPWRAFALTTRNGLIARAGVNLAVSLLPFVAAVANATSATVLTASLGRYFDQAIAKPDVEPAVIGVHSLRDELRRAAGRAHGAA